jgi:hypothetical protein
MHHCRPPAAFSVLKADFERYAAYAAAVQSVSAAAAAMLLLLLLLSCLYCIFVRKPAPCEAPCYHFEIIIV